MVLPQDSYLRFGPYLDLMTGIRTALTINEGIIKVVGPEGCGKTALCRTLASDLKAEGHDVIFFESPPESVEFLHKRIQSELDLPRDKNFTRSLTSYLLAKAPPNNRLIIIYDDAEKISKDIFILIRLLNNVHDTSDTLVSQVICGTAKLDRVFDDPDLRSLTQYLNQSFTLTPMGRDELEDFYSGYKKQAGITSKDLSNKELTDLFIVGKGLPGRTFDLLEQRFSTPLTQTVATDIATPAPTPEPASPATPASTNPASLYAREVDDILDEEDDTPSAAPIYFKAALSLVVVISTLVLAVVLSRDNTPNNPQLTEILADDSPLYLDEVDPDAVIDDVVTDIQVPVLGGPLEATTESGANLADVIPDIERIAAEALADSDITDEFTEAASLPDTDTMPAAVAESTEIPQPSPDSTEAVIEEPLQLPEPEILPLPEILGAVIQSWLDAWGNGDFAGYLEIYHDDFDPPYHDSRDAWQSERQSRIEGVSGITVSFDRFEVMESDEESALVRFWLYYSRGSYADETLKEVGFRRVGEDWLILGERNLELIVR